MDCSVLMLAGGRGTRMGGLGRLMPKSAMVAYDWPLLLRSLYQMNLAGFKDVLISTNPTFYPAVTDLVDGYLNTAPSLLNMDPGTIRVYENALHADGPLPAFAGALQQVTARRCILYLADEFNALNPFPEFAAVVDESADYMGATLPRERWEITSGGVFYADADGVVTSIVEKPNPDAPPSALHWTGMVMFDTQSLLNDVDTFFQQYPPLAPLGEMFEFRRAAGKPVRALINPDNININVNTADDLLMAGLYVALERHADKPVVHQTLSIAAATLRKRS